jgi:hypothetical protein
MSAIFESRLSDSPYIEILWRGRVEQDYAPLCPADRCWNLLFMEDDGKVRVSVEGATDQTVLKQQRAGLEFLVIKFRLGVFMPHLPAGTLLNTDALLPDASSTAFWLNGAAWQFPDFENAEAFVARLVREDVLMVDPVVQATLVEQPAPSVELSSRTVRRRFLRSTGLTHGTIYQIERAQRAAALLQGGTPILDVVDEAGYADQPHLTRSLRRFYGQTPAQMLRESRTGV